MLCYARRAALAAHARRTARDGGALAGALGFDRGFDFYEAGGEWDGPPGDAELNSIERATNWLRDHSGEPVFLFIHSYRTRPFRFAVGVDGRGPSVRLVCWARASALGFLSRSRLRRPGFL